MGYLLSNHQFSPTQSTDMCRWRWLKGLFIAVALGLFSPSVSGYQNTVYAQVLPDRTLDMNSSSVSNGFTSNGLPAQLVNGGLQKDTNLFHSFSDLNITEAEALYFVNPANVEHIFTRVTGGSRSNIFGTLGVDGPADFYLLNPAGVMFGDRASLDVQGAFFVTTGEAITFADGSRFDAAGTVNSSLLTVSVPLGLQYQPRPMPGNSAITTANKLAAPQSLNFVADTISVRGALRSHHINLQGNRIQLEDGADLKTNANGTNAVGNISLTAQTGGISLDNNVELISETNSSASGGNISLTSLNGPINITNDVELRSGNRGNRGNGTGNAGNIHIQGAQISLTDNVEVRAEVEGSGQAGNIRIESLERPLTLEDTVIVRNNVKGSGDGGEIDLIAQNNFVNIRNNVYIHSDVHRNGTGNAGDIHIQGNRVFLEGVNNNRKVEILASAAGAFGNAGNVRIESLDGSIRLEDNVEILAETNSQGNGGNISLIAQNNAVRIRDNVEIRSGVREAGVGDAGDIHIRGNRVFLDGRDKDRKVEIRTESAGNVGNAGNILIEALANDAILQDNVDIRTDSINQGNGGNITVRAPNGQVVLQDDINFISSVRSSGQGDAGNILIDARSIAMQDNVRLHGRNEARGNGGNITLQAQEDIVLDGGSRGSVGLFSSLEKNAVGTQAGDVNLSGRSIHVVNATLQSNSLGRGNAGNVRINAAEIARFTGVRTLVFSRINPGAVGTGGNLEITAPRVEIMDKAQLTAGSSGQGDAGNVIVRTGNLLVIDDASILATTFDNSNGGKIQIEAPSGIVRLENNGRLVSGVAGAAVGNSGDIEINTGRLILVNGGRIVTSTQGVIPSLLLASIEDLEYIELVQDDQPLVYWPLDETAGRQIGDASDTNLEGTVVGVVDLKSPGVSNTGAGFNGGNGRLSHLGNNTPTLDLQDQEFTVEAWVRPDANPSRNQTFLSLFSSNDENQNFSVGLNRDGSIRVSFSSPQSNSGYRETHTTSRGLIDFNDSDRWHHIAVTYEANNGGLIKIFLNGSAVTIRNLGPFAGESPTLTVGDWANVDHQGFNGTVDEVAIYSGVLTDQRITSHYLLGQQNVRTVNSLLNSPGNAGAGDISIHADTILIAGVRSGLFASTDGEFSGDGGNINVQAGTVAITDQGEISAQSQGQGDAGQIRIQANTLSVSERGAINAQASQQGDAGQIIINLTGNLLLRNADIATASTQSSGGAIAITANAMRLLGDSNIRTDIATGQEAGGNITLRAESIIALDDSDILAFSQDGRGGNIILDTPAFFGENFFAVSNNLDLSELFALDGNDRVDVNASGRIDSGVVILPDVSLVQNTLTTLPDTLLSSDELLASSCVARHPGTDNFFLVSGADGLPLAHTSASMSSYELDTVNPLPLVPASNEFRATSEANPLAVKEPHRLYQLADGRLVVSQECS